jgi:phosphonopyruvate decarboxylase
MPGLEALRLLSKYRRDEVVVMHESNRADWPLVSTRPELDILIAYAMSKASSFTLGMALGRPDVGFWVLDGDGALLMNLGSLVTIAGMRPANLLHVVYNNEAYDTTGGQPLPAAGTVNFEGLALAAGYPSALTVSTLAALEEKLPAFLQAPRPALLVLRIASRGRLPTAAGLRSTRDALSFLSEYLSVPPA